MSVLPFVLTAVFAALAALPQSIVGFGLPLVLAPLLVHVLGASDTVVVVNVLTALSATMIAWRLRASLQRRTAFTLLGAALVGLPVGLGIHVLVDENVLQALIAIAILGGALAIIFGGFTIGGGARMAVVAGALGGVLRTSTGAASPPVVIYLRGRDLPADAFRATSTFYLAATGALAAALLAAAGEFNVDVGWAVLAGIPGIIAGNLAGAALAGHVSERWFRHGVMTVLIVSALVALVTAFLG